MSHNIPFGPADETDFTSFQEVSSNQIRRLLESLNTRKAPGSDEHSDSLLVVSLNFRCASECMCFEGDKIMSFMYEKVLCCCVQCE